MQMMDPEGKVLWEKKTEGIKLKAGRSVLQHDIALDALLKGVDSGKVIFYTKVVKDDQLLSENVYYFVNTRIMELPDPGILTEVIAGTNGTVTIRITVGRLAKNIYLLPDSDPASDFSDNYFDLLPGRTVTITVNTSLSLQQVQEQLKVISLRDTFKN